MRFEDIDKTFVISLPDSKRRMAVKEQLQGQFIYFYWYDGIKMNDGADGLKTTFKKLFTECLENGYKNVLVFEDDAMLLTDMAITNINWVLEDLPDDFHICKLGANLLCPVEGITDYISRIKMSFALHASIYSKNGIELILNHIDNREPIDVIIAKHIEPLNKCYVSNQMLVTQRPGKSDIFVYDPKIHHRLKYYEKETEFIRWDILMEEQWERNTKHLNVTT